jgi:outer membrane autotransporter protein
MPELANIVGFAMIDNFDQRMLSPQDPAPSEASPTLCLPTKKSDALPTRKPSAGCVSPAEFDAARRASLDRQMEAVRRRLFWARAIGLAGNQKEGAGGYSWNNGFLNGKGPDYSYSLGGFEAGVTPWSTVSRDGSIDTLGGYLGYSIANANVNSVYSGAKAGTVTIDAYSLGAYWTHVGPGGWYLDTVLQGTWYGQVQGSALTGLSVTGSGFAASVTAGQPLRWGPSWVFEPQAQLIYQGVQLGSGTDLFGTTSFQRTNDLRGRLGIKASYLPWKGIDGFASGVTLWTRASVWHDFVLNAPAATFADFGAITPYTVNGTLQGTWGELDFGADTRVSPNMKLSASVYLYRSIDGASSSAVGGQISATVAF